MVKSLQDFKVGLVEAAAGMLWRHWALFGVPAEDTSARTPELSTRLLIDPEALVLLTSVIGRYEARLFDEMLDWLSVYGRLINIQRLRSLHRLYKLGDPQVLAATAATLRQNSRLVKWKAIESLGRRIEKTSPFFLNRDGSFGAVFGEPDIVFASFGFHRGPFRARKHASSPSVDEPSALLIKLRSLLGVNSRADVLAFLLTNHRGHPSLIAKRTGYFKRSILDVLNEMSLSGHVIADSSKTTREKYFWVRPGDWNFLITWPPPKEFPQWIDWPILFAALQQILAVLETESSRGSSSMLTSMRVREAFGAFEAQFAETGLARFFRLSLQERGADFLNNLLAELERLKG
jgi:hypothetical protein